MQEYSFIKKRYRNSLLRSTVSIYIASTSLVMGSDRVGDDVSSHHSSTTLRAQGVMATLETRPLMLNTRQLIHELHEVRSDFLRATRAHHTPDYLHNTTPYELVAELKKTWKAVGRFDSNDHFTGLNRSGTLIFEGGSVIHSDIPIIPRMVFPHLLVSPKQRQTIKELLTSRPELFPTLHTQGAYRILLLSLPAYTALLDDIGFTCEHLPLEADALKLSPQNVKAIQSLLNQCYTYYRGYLDYLVNYKAYGLTTQDVCDVLEHGPTFLTVSPGALDEHTTFCIPRTEAVQLVPQLSQDATSTSPTNGERFGVAFPRQAHGTTPPQFYIKHASSSEREFTPAHELATFALNKTLFPHIPLPPTMLATISTWEDTTDVVLAHHYLDLDSLMKGRSESPKVFKQTFAPFEGKYNFRRYNRRNYSLQVSRFIHGKRLTESTPEEIAQLSPEDFTRLLIGSLLSFPTDYKTDNFRVTDSDPKTGKRRLYAIDNDDSLGIELRSAQIRTNLKNSLWLLPNMNTPLSLTVVSEFKQLLEISTPNQLITQWLLMLQQQMRLYDVYHQQGRRLRLEAGVAVDIPLSLPSSLIERMQHIVERLKKTLHDYPRLTGVQLLNRGYTCDPDKPFTQELDIIAKMYTTFLAPQTPKPPSHDFHQVLTNRLHRYIAGSETASKGDLLINDAQVVQLNTLEQALRALPVVEEIEGAAQEVSTLLSNAVHGSYAFQRVDAQTHAALQQSVLKMNLPLWSYIVQRQEAAKYLLPISTTLGASFTDSTLQTFYRMILRFVTSSAPIEQHIGKEAFHAWKKLESVDPMLKWIRARETLIPVRRTHEQAADQWMPCTGILSGERKLSPETQRHLFVTNAEGDTTINPEGQLSGARHPVYRVSGQDVDNTPISLVIKLFPEFPMLEMAVYELAKQLNVHHLFPYMDVVLIKVKNGARECIVPALVQQDLGTTTFADILNSPHALATLDATQLQHLILFTMLLNPEDGKPNNYIISNNTVYAIDNERAFTHSVAMNYGDKEIILPKSALFCLDQMNDPVLADVKLQWRQRATAELMQQWVESMVELQQKALWMSGNLPEIESANTLSPSALLKTHMIIPFYPDSVKGLYTRYVACVDAMTDATDETLMVTILKEVNQYVWQRYNQVRDLPTVLERVDAADASFYAKDVLGNFTTTTSQKHLLPNATETLEDYSRKGEYSGPHQALEIVKACQANQVQAIERYVLDMPAALVIKRLQSGWVLTPDQQTVVLKALNTRCTSHHDPIHILPLVGFTELPSAKAHPNVLASVRTLHLAKLPKLNSKSLKALLLAISQLEKLICVELAIKEVCDFISKIPFDEQKALELESLTYLEVSDNPNLERVWISAPKLKDMKTKNCPKLTDLRLDHWDALENVNGTDATNLKAVFAIVPQLQRKTPINYFPRIASEYEQDYWKFLRGKLVYKPNKDNNEGMKEFRIGDLENPLSGTFNIRGCGDSDQHLSISTGFRTTKTFANRKKVEVWIVPQFVLQKDPRAKPYNNFLQAQTEHRGKLFAVLFNWGGWNANDYDHVVTGVVGNEFNSLDRLLATDRGTHVHSLQCLAGTIDVVRFCFTVAESNVLANYFILMSE